MPAQLVPLVSPGPDGSHCAYSLAVLGMQEAIATSWVMQWASAAPAACSTTPYTRQLRMTCRCPFLCLCHTNAMLASSRISHKTHGTRHHITKREAGLSENDIGPQDTHYTNILLYTNNTVYAAHQGGVPWEQGRHLACGLCGSEWCEIWPGYEWTAVSNGHRYGNRCSYLACSTLASR